MVFSKHTLRDEYLHTEASYRAMQNMALLLMPRRKTWPIPTD